MRRILVPGLILTLLLNAVPCARAQDSLESTSGRKYEGKVLSNDGNTVEFQTNDGAKLKLPIDQLTPKSQYSLRAAAATDGKSQLALAEWCVDQTLYKEAKAQFRKALETDPAMEEEIKAHLATARTKASKELLERGKKLQASNQKQEGRRILSVLVQELPLEDASKEAAQILAKETAEREQQALSRRAPAAAPKDAGGAGAGAGADVPKRESGEPFSEATVKLFQPVIDSYKKLLDATQDGLTKGGSAGIKEYEKALKEGDKIRAAADKIKPQAANNEEITEALALTDTKLQEAVVDLRINMADSYMLRSSFNQAAEVVQQGLAVYPKDDRLRQTMSRVTAASAESDDGGWTVGPRGRVR